MSVPSWRGRDPHRDCESEGCEGESTCIHCDGDMIDFPEEDAATLRAIHATNERAREELKVSTDKIFADLDKVVKP